jgi:uncharacterized protein (DUF885 family)
VVRIRFTLALAAVELALAQSSAQSVHAFFKDTFEQMLRNDPQFATAIGRHEFDDRWTDYSQQARAKRRQFFEDRLKTATQFPAAALSDEDSLTLRVVQSDFRSRLDSSDLETHLLSVGQMFGFHNRVYTLIDRMPARTVHDYRNVIARLQGIPMYVDQYIGIMNEAVSSKMMQPRIVADLVAQQLTTQMNQDAEHSALLAAFRKFPSNISPAEQEQLRREATEAYNKDFLPAWRKAHDYVGTTYTEHVRPTDSLSSIPDGHHDYAILIHRLTTTNITAQEIHSIGEQEVRRIEQQMHDILGELHFTGSIAEFQKKLDATPEQHFQSKEEMLAYCRNIAKIIEPELPTQFHHLPMLLYGVRPIPPDREAATATNAQAPSPDFTTPGWFNLNTYRPEKQVKYDKESLVLHEAVPGHIFQITLAEAQQRLPELRKFYSNSAFVEGWALYSESLGSQLGLYRNPYSRFGQLASERFRAVRLVVDTGIHELGWTRNQAIQYFQAHAPEQPLAEIDRYISWPAQALSYKIGQIRISSLRKSAERTLGPKFDVREFNDAIIRDGTLPLDLLSEQVKEFVAEGAGK